jgi:DNA-damage-inducible protein D
MYNPRDNLRGKALMSGIVTNDPTGGEPGIFDAIKKTSAQGVDYWLARDLQDYLGFERWERFEEAIERAMEACEKSGLPSHTQFRAYAKLVNSGSGAKREVRDYYLTRYACYLIAMNCHPSKARVALAQSYFAVQTRRMEIADHGAKELSEDEQRLMLREKIKESNTTLKHTASSAGVTNFGFFGDAGYRGMYNASQTEVKKMKSIRANEDFLDCIGPLELSANDFRIRLTEEKLRQDRIKGQAPAENAHRTVGKKVRKLVVDEIGTPPEKLPRAESIKKIASRKRKELKGK